MQNISFSLTLPQFLDGSKSITRRLGWRNLKPGDRLMAVNKCMGFKKGEKPIKYGEIEIVSVRREPLWWMLDEDCPREGFPSMNAVQFGRMFCKAMNCTALTEVTRIEFVRVDVAQPEGK